VPRVPEQKPQCIDSPISGTWSCNRSYSIAAIGKQHQLNLPISIFFLIALWLWYTNESMIPETVNTPAHQEQ